MGACVMEANQDMTRKQSNLLTHAALHPYFHHPRSAYNKRPASSDAVSICHSSDTVCALFSGKLSHDTTKSIGVDAGTADWEWARAEVRVRKQTS